MATSRLERENLEAHVDLCAERYKTLEEKFSRLESKVDQIADGMGKMVEKQQQDKVASNKLIIGAAGSVIAGLLSTIVLLLMNLNNVAPVLTAVGQ